MADNSTKIVITAEDRTQAALASVRNGFSGLTKSLSGLDALASKIPFLAGGLVAAFGGLAAAARHTIDAADNLGKLSQKIGITVEDLAGFEHAAKLSDLSTEQFAQGVKQLSRYMGDAGDKLKAAGITATDAKGALIQIADSFAAMPDGVKKTAIAMELMGKSITEPLANIFTSFIGSLFADGGVVSGPGISAYSGQIVSKPTVFPFASGIGLMGEAGPEAILPLKRSSNGRLGIEGGGSAVQVNVINNATGAQATANERMDGGVRIIDVMIESVERRIAGNIADGRGPVTSALATSYGLNRAAGGF